MYIYMYIYICIIALYTIWFVDLENPLSRMAAMPRCLEETTFLEFNLHMDAKRNWAFETGQRNP